jgi:hypothetical protein
MKIQSLYRLMKKDKCLNFRHVSMFIFCTLMSLPIHALEINHRIAASRAPASAFEEEVLTVPLSKKEFVQSLFVEDDAGVMKEMHDSLEGWSAKEEYARNWNLNSTNLYKTPSAKQKGQFISKNLLRYADKRLAGEMKNAEEGSTLHSMGQVEKSLRPNASVPVSKYVSLKFRARVLQGKGIVEVKNPWVDCTATVGANGKTRVLTKKDFAELGMSTGFEYKVNESQVVAYLDQQITDNIKARVSSTSRGPANDADNRVEMTASFPFNL